MFKIWRNIGLILIIIVSFIYTEKLVSVVKEYDEIMIQIKEEKNNFKINPIEAIIEGNTIIAGVNGRIVNIEKSYKKMREYGKYNSSLFVYNSIFPKNRLIDNKDKYIVGGSKKNKVSIIFKNPNKEILNLGKNYNYYINKNWYNTNKNIINNYIKKGYIFLFNNSYLKKMINQNIGYCYTENMDDNVLKNCYKNNDYTILPSLIIRDNSLYKLEKNLKSGIIIVVDTNNYKNVINYIISKGYEIVSIDELIDEKIN